MPLTPYGLFDDIDTMSSFRFTLEQASVSTGLYQSALEDLIKNDLAPPSAGGGRRRPRLFDDQGIAYLALVGALHNAGVELRPAARVIRAIIDDGLFMSTGKIHDRLEDYEREALAVSGEAFLTERAKTDLSDRFAFHCLLSKHLRDRNHLVASEHEMVLEIADRKYVFYGRKNLQTMALFSDGAFALQAVARMTGWERGANAVTLVSLHDEACADPYSARHIEREYHAHRSKSVSVIRINVSLAVRLAFERLRTHLQSPIASQPAGGGPS